MLKLISYQISQRISWTGSTGPLRPDVTSTRYTGIISAITGFTTDIITTRPFLFNKIPAPWAVTQGRCSGPLHGADVIEPGPVSLVLIIVTPLSLKIIITLPSNQMQGLHKVMPTRCSRAYTRLQGPIQPVSGLYLPVPAAMGPIHHHQVFQYY